MAWAANIEIKNLSKIFVGKLLKSENGKALFKKI